MRLVIRYEADPRPGDAQGAACTWVLQGADLNPPNWARLAHVFGELYVTMQLGMCGDELEAHVIGCECCLCTEGAA